jgi:hypothetical protein
MLGSTAAFPNHLHTWPRRIEQWCHKLRMLQLELGALGPAEVCLALLQERGKSGGCVCRADWSGENEVLLSFAIGLESQAREWMDSIGD